MQNIFLVLPWVGGGIYRCTTLILLTKNYIGHKIQIARL